MSKARTAGPVALTCVLFLAVASGCGEEGGDITSAPSPSTTECWERPDLGDPEVPIVVAAQDIPAGTTAAEAAANGMLREDAIPSSHRPASAIKSLDELTGGVAVADLGTNELVTYEHFGLQTDTTLGPSGPSCVTGSPTTTAPG